MLRASSERRDDDGMLTGLCFAVVLGGRPGFFPGGEGGRGGRPTPTEWIRILFPLWEGKDFGSVLAVFCQRT